MENLKDVQKLQQLRQMLEKGKLEEEKQKIQEDRVLKKIFRERYPNMPSEMQERVKNASPEELKRIMKERASAKAVQALAELETVPAIRRPVEAIPSSIPGPKEIIRRKYTGRVFPRLPVKGQAPGARATSLKERYTPEMGKRYLAQKMDEALAEEIVDKLSVEADWIRKVVLIRAFLDDQNLLGRLAQFHREKVRNGMYTANQLIGMNTVDFLPEVFYNPKLSSADKLQIEQKVQKFIDHQVNLVLATLDPTAKRNLPYVPEGVRITQAASIHEICENVPPEKLKDVVIIREDQKFYCLDLNLLRDHPDVNYVTQQKLSPECSTNVQYALQKRGLVPEVAVPVVAGEIIVGGGGPAGQSAKPNPGVISRILSDKIVDQFLNDLANHRKKLLEKRAVYGTRIEHLSTDNKAEIATLLSEIDQLLMRSWSREQILQSHLEQKQVELDALKARGETSAARALQHYLLVLKSEMEDVLPSEFTVDLSLKSTPSQMAKSLLPISMAELDEEKARLKREKLERVAREKGIVLEEGISTGLVALGQQFGEDRKNRYGKDIPVKISAEEVVLTGGDDDQLTLQLEKVELKERPERSLVASDKQVFPRNVYEGQKETGTKVLGSLRKQKAYKTLTNQEKAEQSLKSAMSRMNAEPKNRMAAPGEYRLNVVKDVFNAQGRGEFGGGRRKVHVFEEVDEVEREVEAGQEQEIKETEVEAIRQEELDEENFEIDYDDEPADE